MPVLRKYGLWEGVRVTSDTLRLIATGQASPFPSWQFKCVVSFRMCPAVLRTRAAQARIYLALLIVTVANMSSESSKKTDIAASSSAPKTDSTNRQLFYFFWLVVECGWATVAKIRSFSQPISNSGGKETFEDTPPNQLWVIFPLYLSLSLHFPTLSHFISRYHILLNNVV